MAAMMESQMWDVAPVTNLMANQLTKAKNDSCFFRMIKKIYLVTEFLMGDQILAFFLTRNIVFFDIFDRIATKNFALCQIFSPIRGC